MQWAERGIIVGVRRHGETSVILELLTRERGRALGLVRGGRSRRMRPVLQPGNTVVATWRARLDEQLGFFGVEPDIDRAARLMADRAASYAVGVVSDYIRLLPERDPHPRLHDALAALLDHLAEPLRGPELFARFELMLLEELGAGLDLEACAATGVSDDLAWVSPRTGRAVGREPGLPYTDRLLALPAFLLDNPDAAAPPPAQAIADALALTGFFLARNVFGPRNRALPELRDAYLAALDLGGRRAARDVQPG